MTLIAVYNSEGCVGRCDASCYQAKHSECTCICGGRNHGKGLKRAMVQTRALAETWIKEYTGAHNLKEYTAEVNAEVYQLPLL